MAEGVASPSVAAIDFADPAQVADTRTDTTAKGVESDAHFVTCRHPDHS
jgi:hypothetical protein